MTDVLRMLSTKDLEAMQSGDLSSMSTNGLRLLQKQTTEPAPPNDAIDTANAVGTGYFRGLTRLAGLPVDTVANVIDLGKAAIGAPYIALTGKEPPKFLQLGKRADVVGSGENLIKNLSKTSAGDFMINPENPEYEGGYAQLLGGALTGINSPSTKAQLVNQGALSLVGGAAGKAAYDATGNEALAIAAGMSPALGQQALTGATRYAVRGGEKGRREMAQRIQDLKNAGVENPTMGLASGNKFIGGVENLLQSTPGAVGVMGKNRDKAIAGLNAKAQEAAELASTNRGAMESGTAIQTGIKDFKDRFKIGQSILYDKMGNVLPTQFPADVGKTRATLAALNEDIPGAPEVSKQFKNSRIQAIEDAILKDLGVTPTGSTRVINEPTFGRAPTSPAPDMMGQPVYRGALSVMSTQPGKTVSRPGATRPDLMGRPVPVGPEVNITIPGRQVPIFADAPMRTDSFGSVVPVSPMTGQRTSVIRPTNTGPFSGVGLPPQITDTLPFEAVKKMRTLVGNEIADNSLISSVPQSKWKALYAGLSDDLGVTASRAGPEAERAFNRATDYTRSGVKRLERVAPFAEKAAPEQAFKAMVNAANENVSTLQAVKKTLPENARGTVAGTVIERLGKANNGVQNETGSVWSPETFLTNWNKMTPKGRDELFSGFKDSAQVKQHVDAVAKATAMMRDNSKMWANPSGTAANAAARATLGALSVGGAGSLAGFLNPLIPLGAGATMVGVNQLSKWLTNPENVSNMAAQNYFPERLQNSVARSMVGSGALSQYGRQQAEQE